MFSVSPTDPDLPNCTVIHCENCGSVAHLVNLHTEVATNGVTQIWAFSCESCSYETERRAD